MPVLPSSLIAITSLLRGAFTAPTFEIFEALVAGFISRVGDHTITGIWQAAQLAGRLHHSRAHDFFARASWSPDELGLLLADFLIERFLAADTPISLAVDGSVFTRGGPKVHGACRHHDSGTAPGGGFRFGNCFVVVGLVVRIPALGARAWCLPLLFRLWLPTPKPTKAVPQSKRRPSQQDLAAELVAMLAKRHRKRAIDVVGDSAFGCKAMAALPERVSLTSRLRSNAVISAPKPAPSGKRGRPRVKGERLGNPAEIARAAKASDWRRVEVRGRGEVMALVVSGLWYSVFGSRAVQVVIVCELADSEGYRIALVSTDLKATAAEIIARYSDRWSIEVAFQDAKHTVGAGQARNRVKQVVERTVPFGLLCQSIAVAWYALHADPGARCQAPSPGSTLVPPKARSLDARRARRPAPRADPGGISARSGAGALMARNQPGSDVDWAGGGVRLRKSSQVNVLRFSGVGSGSGSGARGRRARGSGSVCRRSRLRSAPGGRCAG